MSLHASLGSANAPYATFHTLFSLLSSIKSSSHLLLLASHTSFSFTFLSSFFSQPLINVALLLSIIRAAILLLSHPTQLNSNPYMHPMHNQH